MRRFLLISLGVHAAAALLALLWILLPRAPGAPPPELPPDMTPVEVVRAPGAEAAPPPTPPPAPDAKPAEQASPPAPEEPQAEGGMPPPAPEPKQAEAAPDAPPSQPAPERPQVRVDLGAAGLTDEIRGEDVVSPGPDPSHQNIPPRFPREAAMRGEGGVVALLVRIGASGEVDGIEVVRSSGHASLDAAARDAVLRWRFIPATEDGVAHASERVLSFNFEEPGAFGPAAFGQGRPGEEGSDGQDRPGDDAGRRRR